MSNKTALVLLNEGTNELLLYLRTGHKTTLLMRFEKNDSATAIYCAIKKAASLRYDFGWQKVKVEINGLPSSEMSYVVSTKFEITN